MKKSTNKLISVVLVFLILSSYTTAFAFDKKVSTYDNISYLDTDENYYVSSINEGHEEINSTSKILFDNSLNLETIISKSVNIQKISSNSYSGKFTSDKYNAGILGYKFQIKFDWVAKVNSSGDYIFDKITNYKLVTYTNYIVLALTWDSYSYKVSSNTYSLSSNRKTITCVANYIFDLYEKNTKNHITAYEPNRKIFNIDQML